MTNGVDAGFVQHGNGDRIEPVQADRPRQSHLQCAELLPEPDRELRCEFGVPPVSLDRGDGLRGAVRAAGSEQGEASRDGAADGGAGVEDGSQGKVMADFIGSYGHHGFDGTGIQRWSVRGEDVPRGDGCFSVRTGAAQERLRALIG
ncbi:hypothetical protein ACFC1R_34035 [Kitasatospora sp. NPDC056138]|uniref:hypothetical protein n=1 Tax=Kitasatospora sp. NPDC056138 TaxID=3345724 RepID=UPI0035DB8BC8